MKSRTTNGPATEPPHQPRRVAQDSRAVQTEQLLVDAGARPHLGTCDTSSQTTKEAKLVDAGTQHLLGTRDTGSQTTKEAKLVDTGTQHHLDTRETSSQTIKEAKLVDAGTQHHLGTRDNSSQTTKEAKLVDDPARRPAAPPPLAVPPRITRSTRPEHYDELQDPDLFPKTSSRRPTTDTTLRFLCDDGTAPRTTPTTLYRYDIPVLVADLNLSARSTAGRAARRGYYFDSIQGRRLYLQ